MKKIIGAIFISLVTGLFYTTTAMSEMKMGISAVGGLFNAKGAEKEANESNKASEEAVFAYGEVWIENSFDQGFSLGFGWVPHSLDTEVEERTDVPLTAAGSTDSGSTSDSGTNRAQADIENLITVYATVPLMDTGFYAKLGVHHMDIISGESLTTGSTYGNTDVFGGTIGLGYEHDAGNVFVRAEIGASAWEEISLLSQTNSDNQVTADVEGITARISIGKAF